MVWTASTIKLAMTVDLFLRDRAGSITLSGGDRTLIQEMLHSSDDNAADALWFKYSGADHMTFNNDFPRSQVWDDWAFAEERVYQVLSLLGFSEVYA
jgi:hypothetical protein